ncbi:MAG: DUF1080 domain-containing protein [Saprospiraceae bacterium]|nr:DUF1080 domain-containing protein [Saprospiraceae bacterium]
MRRTNTNLIGLILISTLYFTNCNPALTDENSSDPGDWIILFDGTNTDAWRGYNRETFPNLGWYIDDEGSLCVEKTGTEEEGFGGDIITKEAFENYEFEMEFMVSDTGNSGILYRVTEHSDSMIWHNAPEFQILDDAVYRTMLGDSMMFNKYTAALYDMIPAPEDYSNPVGEWNSAKIVVNNNRVEHWLNDHKVVDYTIGSAEWETLYQKSKFGGYPQFSRATVGHIGLQDHGHLIKFRNMRIKPLPTSFTSIFNEEDLDGWEVYGTETWKAENGEIVCESGPDAQYGYLATEQEYQDFELTLQFLQEADGNSGVFFRSQIEGTKIAGWQAEVAPPGRHTGGVYESYGRGWLIQPDSTLNDVLKMGDWNDMRIYVHGDRVITWLNGVEMVNFQDEKIGEATGKIALQIHDGGGIRVRWKNLMIRSL